ncbi:hypothetical protein HDV62DRAFT_374290 [Trichoderma sp. SZMC 28011]
MLKAIVSASIVWSESLTRANTTLCTDLDISHTVDNMLTCSLNDLIQVLAKVRVNPSASPMLHSRFTATELCSWPRPGAPYLHALFLRLQTLGCSWWLDETRLRMLKDYGRA